MMLNDFIACVRNGQAITFQDTMAVIAKHYDYQPAEFCNGKQHPLVNKAGANEGSCKIFAFAKLHQLNEAQTLSLFGDYYRIDVLNYPEGNDHQNIRNFMQDGWEGISFKSEALTRKYAD